jgi:hypothetical protein
MEVEVAVEDAVGAATVLEADVEGVELEESDRAITGSASADAALVDVAVRAATMSVLKTKTVRLVTRTLATENAITLFFIPSYIIYKNHIYYTPQTHTWGLFSSRAWTESVAFQGWI